ncbi:MFS transporter [Amycolatopsis sp. NPDC005232]|uniref:MFS transporter n=1 Tax=Amycolatopsis sp. NPDC005232 TaxID=3157027 RepID=UPI0033AEC46F
MSRAPAGNWLRVALAMVGVGWGANQVAPLLLVYRTRDHLPETAVTAMFGIYAVGLIPALLVAGPYSDRHGRRVCVRLGVAVSLIASLVMIAGATTPWLLFLGRFLSGLASGVAFSAGSAWLKELSGRAGPGAGARRATIALSLGFGGGPLIAGAVAEWLPSPAVIPYLVHVALMAVAIPLVWSAPPGAPESAVPRHSLIPAAARSPRFLLGVLPWAPWVFGIATIGFATLPAVISQQVGQPVVLSGGVAGLVLAAGIAVQPLARWLGRSGDARAEVAGLLVATAGLVVCALVAATQAAVLVPVAAVVLGSGYGVLLVTGLRTVERLANPGETAGLVAIFYALTYTGLAAPYLLAMFAGGHRYTVVLLAAALITLLTVPLAIAGVRRPAPHPDARTPRKRAAPAEQGDNS